MISYIKLFLTHVKRIGMMNKMIKLVIFDLDGTLINSIYDLADAVNDSLIKMGIPFITWTKYYHFVGNGTVKLSERLCLKNTEAKRKLKSFMLFFQKNIRNAVLIKQDLTTEFWMLFIN